MAEDGRCENEISKRKEISKTPFLKLRWLTSNRSISMASRKEYIKIYHCRYKIEGNGVTRMFRGQPQLHIRNNKQNLDRDTVS